MRFGVEIWNRPDDGTPEEREKVTALGCSVVKIRGYHPLSLIDWLLELNPDILFLVRSDVDGSFVVPETVLDCLEYREAHHIYLLDNEPNHLDSPWRNNFDGYLDRLRQHIDEAKSRFPRAGLSSPPMAVMQDDLAWYERLIPYYEKAEIGWHAQHIYWQGDNYSSPDWGRRIEQYDALTTGLPWLVDELGDSSDDKPAAERADAIIDVLTYLHNRGDVKAACLFLACGGTDDWAKYILPLEECRRIGEAVAGLQQPAPAPETPQFLMGFADYAAGRDWTPINQERPDWEGNAYQDFIDVYGREGTMKWFKADNRIRHAFWEE